MSEIKGKENFLFISNGSYLYLCNIFGDYWCLLKKKNFYWKV